MSFAPVGPIALLLLPVAATACMTAREAEGAQRDMATIRLRLDSIDRLGEQHQHQLVELTEVLDRATKLLKLASEDTWAKEAKAEEDIAALEARVAEITLAVESQGKRRSENENRFETRLAALEQVEARIVDKVAALLPEDRETLWRQAAERLSSPRKEEGRHFYRVFIQRFPDDPRSPQAYQAIGLSYVQEKQFPRAAAEFRRLLDTYPRSPEAPNAMWQLALAYRELHFCKDARSLLGDLAKRFPNSPPAGEAQKEIKSIKKLPKAACTS